MPNAIRSRSASSWQAKERGAKIIHVDPRYTRTSAVADLYAPIRSGTDIVFLGALINWVLTNERYFKEYVVAFTNASRISCAKISRIPKISTACFPAVEARRAGNGHRAAGVRPAGFEMEDVPRFDGEGTVKIPKRDETFAHPRCVLNVLRRHFSRYTPQMVEDVCGMPAATMEQIANLLAGNSGRERTTAFAYAVGWTQHTVGVQYIRTAAILQTLLGNMGRPGGGIMALRGHANIQGATDIPTLYDLLPGYLPMPSTLRDEQTYAGYLKNATKPGWWSNAPKYMTSLLKAYYGDAATPENDFCFEYLPQISGDYSVLPTQISMKDGNVKGYFVIGMNPASSGQNAELARAALERLEWMVVVDSYETETASFWRREGADPVEDRHRNVLSPMRDRARKRRHDGQHQPDAAVARQGARPGRCQQVGPLPDLSARHAAQNAVRRFDRSEGPADPATSPGSIRTRTSANGGAANRPRPSVLQEINGYKVEPAKPGYACEQVAAFADLKDDGSTACGAWIYSGVFPDKETNRARNRTKDDWTSLGWGFSWPANRRMLYNRASADPDGKPWSERKKYMYWDEEAKKWAGPDIPDFPVAKAPHTPRKPGATGIDAHAGSDPFIMQPDGRMQLFAAGTLKDGPFPAHYEPMDSVVRNHVYSQQSNPALRECDRDDNRYNGPLNPDFPYVLTTYRLTEHSGIMTRYVPWLAELQPALFVEIDPELAVEKGIKNGGWATVTTRVGEIEARALVSGRMRPLRLGKGQRVHQIGIPYNYGTLGFTQRRRRRATSSRWPWTRTSRFTRPKR